MKVGDLVQISCTCGKAHDEEPLVGVVVDRNNDTNEVEVLVRGIRTWVPLKGLGVLDESR